MLKQYGVVHKYQNMQPTNQMTECVRGSSYLVKLDYLFSSLNLHVPFILQLFSGLEQLPIKLITTLNTLHYFSHKLLLQIQVRL